MLFRGNSYEFGLLKSSHLRCSSNFLSLVLKIGNRIGHATEVGVIKSGWLGWRLIGLLNSLRLRFNIEFFDNIPSNVDNKIRFSGAWYSNNSQKVFLISL